VDPLQLSASTNVVGMEGAREKEKRLAKKNVSIFALTIPVGLKTT